MNAHKLIDAAKELLGLNSDAALADYLGTSAPYISKIRTGRLAVGDIMFVRLSEALDKPVRELRALMA